MAQVGYPVLCKDKHLTTMLSTAKPISYIVESQDQIGNLIASASEVVRNSCVAC
jgi:hypothetical protein